jgi:hypothetical protein
MKCRPLILIVCGASLWLVELAWLNRHPLSPPVPTGNIIEPPGSELNSAAVEPTPSADPLAAAAQRQLPASPHDQPQGAPATARLAPELRCLAEQDPAAAAVRLADLPAELRPEFASAIASAWGKTAPEVAADWARNQLEGETRNQALLSMSADWASVNPSGAADCALAVLPEDRQGEFLNSVAMQWGRQDAPAALAWGDQLPGGTARDSFLAGVASALAESSPAQAAQLVTALGSGSLQNETALTVLIEWGRHDPDSAAEWAKMFPPGHLREQALGNLVALWAQAPAASASAALRNWPEGPERDGAIRHYLDEILESNPARGVEILSAIDDEVLRREEAQRVAQHWLMLDPIAARQWFAQNASTPN